LSTRRRLATLCRGRHLSAPSVSRRRGQSYPRPSRCQLVVDWRRLAMKEDNFHILRARGPAEDGTLRRPLSPGEVQP
jgi:hypothetical protein